MNSNLITIVGCGPGNPDYLTQQASRAIGDARVLIGSKRLLHLLAPEEMTTVACPARSAEAIDVIQDQLVEGPVTVLVSGDTGICSLATPLVRHFGTDTCLLIPGLSSVQVAFSRLGQDWRDARIVTTHAVAPKDFEGLQGHDKLAVLGGGSQSMTWINDFSKTLGLSHAIYLCEDLSLESERIRRLFPARLNAVVPKSLSVFIFIKETQ